MLITLGARRTRRADIIEVFNIMKGLEGLNIEVFLDGSRKQNKRSYVENLQEICATRSTAEGTPSIKE